MDICYFSRKPVAFLDNLVLGASLYGVKIFLKLLPIGDIFLLVLLKSLALLLQGNFPNI